MQGRDQIGLPVDAAVLDGIADAKPFDLAAHIGEIAQLGEGKRRDAKSALRLEHHKAVGREPRQRLPHRARAGAKTNAQLFDLELLAGHEAARQQVAPQALIDILSE